MIICEVCSNEPSKYRCPVCSAQSCSLACTQAHRIYCTPKAREEHAPEPKEQNGLSDTLQNGTAAATHGGVNGGVDLTTTNPPRNSNSAKATLNFSFSDLQSSQELKNLFIRYPALRSKLRDIYRLTLEEEWVEIKHNNYGRGRGRGRGSYAGRGGKSRGPWTEEKGFNRGLGKVKRLRESLESSNGAAGGADAEGFSQFASLVLAAGGDTAPKTTQSQPEG
ncbi:hypothetical protein PAAG_00978 [Paracoccidioides lutzii Pb01]|uniref:HIT-type domain-containing protein n=1 Tax=Paracoccidioides lutzii (strain ATCC MYA-826 / Pb01) TaxID=502779 RepID=C1GR33_PARBA|nr:hypothetical protein PAAG_00978 [Paracoccidioides lutzii Pb01]EEH38057.1 hypothetical protein PAAG_00978 [Paracoccidioides lutzii Pb01]